MFTANATSNTVPGTNRAIRPPTYAPAMADGAEERGDPPVHPISAGVGDGQADGQRDHLDHLAFWSMDEPASWEASGLAPLL